MNFYTACWPFQGHPKSLILEDPYLTKVTKFALVSFWGPEIRYGIHFHIGLFIAPSNSFRCQSWPLTHFTRRRLLRRRWRYLQECHSPQLFGQDVVSTRLSNQNWTENTMVKVSFRYVTQLSGYGLKLKEFASRTFNFWSLITRPNINPE